VPVQLNEFDFRPKGNPLKTLRFLLLQSNEKKEVEIRCAKETCPKQLSGFGSGVIRMPPHASGLSASWHFQVPGFSSKAFFFFSNNLVDYLVWWDLLIFGKVFPSMQRRDCTEVPALTLVGQGQKPTNQNREIYLTSNP